MSRVTRHFTLTEIDAHTQQCLAKLHTCVLCVDAHAGMPYAELLAHYESVAAISTASQVARMLIGHTESDPIDALQQTAAAASALSSKRPRTER
jgi:hypothetical protein